jgi:hypothetical protein
MGHRRKQGKGLGQDGARESIVHWRKQGNGWGTGGSKVREMRHRREQGKE